ncbi:glycoside hydrolase domain-containing protein [Streptomyces sediminimaris]|uniref:glycoside hydrolase domain-containing protein n=1 Tax=Streptomyces sediminimaris TaxID=3383721 RepID=UPI00399B2436
MASIPGLDYAWSHPGGAAVKAAGKKFACRYLSPDRSKNLSRAEADDLAAHGVSSVVVWESTAKRPLSGKSAGAEDAKAAAAQAAACGMPSSRPIYFAVDFDATPGQQTAINAYLDGAASVLGRARVGVYGGYYVVKRALDGGHAKWAWQTFAWSGGQWDKRAAIRQGKQASIGGVSCDLNTALADDYGQWMPGITPQEDDMQLGDQVPLGDWVPRHWPTDKGLADKKIPVWVTLGSGYAHSRIAHENTDKLVAMVAKLQASEAAQTAAITAMAQALARVDTAIDVPALVAQVRQEVTDAASKALEGLHISVTTTPEG